ncbi:hypothetical protein TNCV_4018251 [Trichonephila clavipes]|nr:hypothetical protein TNCV_4018251 [Trichonephila clavipes]
MEKITTFVPFFVKDTRKIDAFSYRSLYGPFKSSRPGFEPLTSGAFQVPGISHLQIMTQLNLTRTVNAVLLIRTVNTNHYPFEQVFRTRLCQQSTSVFKLMKLIGLSSLNLLDEKSES